MTDLLHSVYARALQSPFYRDRLLQFELVAWNRLPLTTKQDLREAYPFGLLGVPMSDLESYHESSGTSGQPISSYFTSADWTDIASRFLRSRVNLASGDMVLVKTPYSMVTTAHQMQTAARLAGATVVPADNRSSNMPYSRVLRLLDDLPVTVTWCLPTEAVIWAFLAKRAGKNPSTGFKTLRALLVAGEPVSPAKLKWISKIWGGRPVIQDYGSTETGSLAGECREGHLHVWSDRVFCEVLDPRSGATSKSGTGSLIVTPFFREGMPLIRYNMEDVVRLSESRCLCGSAAPRIEVFGRETSKVIGGFFQRDLEDVIYGAPFDVWFWRAFESEGRLDLEIHADHPDCARLESDIRARFGVLAEVRSLPMESFVPEEWLQGENVMQKPQYVFSSRDQARPTLAYA